MDKLSIQVKPSFIFQIVLCIFILPIKLVFAWYVAAAIHELGHILLLVLLHKRIYCISVSFHGVIIQTESLTFLEDSIVGMAGPCAGGLLLLLSSHLPLIAVCAFIQSFYNLLPFYPLDGGRALYGLLRIVAGEIVGLKIYHTLIIILNILAVLCVIYLATKFASGWVLLIGALFLLIKIKIACKDRHLAVQ